MRTFQGTFHADPGFALRYGWSEMQRDLTEIRQTAADLQAKGAAAAAAQPAAEEEVALA